MKPFLILQLRPEDAAADQEFQAFLHYGGLGKEEVYRIRMEQEALPVVYLEDFSGVIVGGGPSNISDAWGKKSPKQKTFESWLFTLLREVVEKDVPYLGACYGFGALVASAGAEMSKKQYGEAVGAVTITLTDQATADPLLQGLPSTFCAFVGHKEACQGLPAKAVWLASSPVCPYEMFRLGQNVYAMQFHPELDVPGMNVRIDIYKHAGYFPPEDAEKLKATVQDEKITVPMAMLKRFVTRYKK
jgi:GMP synthase (glutamine-hydrolysing)